MSLPPLSPRSPWLAPLAGYSDLPFRLLCREYGAACAVTEMVSAKGMIYHSPGTRELLATCPADAPLVVQLFGSEPDIMARAMDTLLSRGFEYFDLNAGCPVSKVLKTGSGAALLKDPELLVRLAGVMVRIAGAGRVGVKLRSGFSAGENTALDLARPLEDAGAAWLALHPRTARQGFSGQAQWPEIAALKARVSIPVLASGDLLDAAAARRCLEATGANGVLFARGALHDPTIFTQFLEFPSGGPSPSGAAIAALVRRHADLMLEHGRTDRVLLRMRSILPRYIRQLPQAKALRLEMASCTTWGRFEEILGKVARSESSAEPRIREGRDGGA